MTKPLIFLLGFWFCWQSSSGVALAADAAPPPPEKLCEAIYWTSKPVKIDDFHHRMICGDPKSPAWKAIPLYQAKFHLEAFLQSEGYATPKIELSNDRLMVDAGPKLKLAGIATEPLSPDLEYQLYRYSKKTVTPALLNQLEATAKAYYRNQGYPCAQVTSRMDVASATATVEATLGEQRPFGNVMIDANEAFDAELLRRYYSFHSTDLYRLDDVTLTRQRIDESEVVSGTYFLTLCDGATPQQDINYLQHKYVLGNPRTLRFGFGADTEGGPFVYVSWKNNRYSKTLSQLSANATASFEKQSLALEGKFFPSVETPRFYYLLKPAVQRDTSTDAEELEASVGVTPGQTWDTANRSYRLEYGPYFIQSWHRAEAGDPFSQNFSVALRLEAQMQSHVYELKKGHPEGGSDLSLKLEHRNPKLGFLTNVLRAETSFRKVWDLGYCGRTECFLAIRQNTQIVTIEPNARLEDLPPSLQAFLGDVRTLRGYSMSNFINPGLTQVSFGADLRFRPFAYAKLEPYLLADVGKLGKAVLKLEPDLFYSVGLGLRWFSPIGIVNGFVSRAYSEKSKIDDQWYYFVGLGEGF